MKRGVGILLFLLLLLAFVPAVLALEDPQTEVPEGWTGVWTVEDLRAMADDLSGQYIQMADIEFDPDDYWTPIGTNSSSAFTGSYDGNGYVIRYLLVESTADNQGLFGYADGATLENITLEEASVTGGKNTGGIVGYGYSCSVTDCIVNGYVSGGQCTGGIVGSGSGMFKSCIVNGSIRGTDYSTGGIAGCGHYSTGGTRVMACIVNGSVRGGSNVGGIVGGAFSDNPAVSACRNNAAVTGTGDYVGGIIGRANGISTCWNDASVTGMGDYVGGITGAAYNINNCCNTGFVTGASIVGGIVGQLAYESSNIERCYSIGCVTGSGNRVGGVVGNPYSGNKGTVSFCYYLDPLGAISDNGFGTRVSEDQLRQPGGYEQYDFDTVWTMGGSTDYDFAELRCLAPDEIAVPEPETDEDGRILVRTKYDLYNVMANPAADYIQMADIEFTPTDFAEGGDFYNLGAGWRPIGTSATPFTGTYDGNGFEIRGLQCSSAENYHGLFGYVSGGTLKNIILRDSSFSGKNYVGGIAGYLTYLSNPYYRTCTIDNCSVVNVTVTASGDYAGGIAGFLIRAALSGVTAQSPASITHCSADGIVAGQSEVGGIVGYGSTGCVYAAPSNKYTLISECRNRAEVTGGGNTGGIAGEIRGYYDKTNGTSYAAQINNCYNMGTVSGAAGGIVGSSSNSLISNCYYLDTSVASPTNTEGQALTAEQLRQQESFDASWDFDTVWIMTGSGDEVYAELRCFVISGTLTIAGEPVYGGEVTANVSRVKHLRGYRADWYAGDTLLGTGEPFTVPAEAVGKALTLVITSTDDIYRGSLTSRTVTVGKAACVQTPLPSTELDKSTTEFLVSTESGQEYSLDQKTWQIGGRFTGLEPGTSYTVYTRIAATELYLAGETIEAVTVVTERQSIGGRIRISGIPQYSRELSINSEALAPAGVTFTCEWLWGETVLGTDPTYVPAVEDIGREIYARVSGTGQFKGSAESTSVTIAPCDITVAAAEMETAHTYTRSPISPEPALKNGDLELKRGTDYETVYENNTDAGTAAVHITGIGLYQGTMDLSFTIEPKQLDALSLAAIPNAYYTGAAIEPELTILFGDYRLIPGQDYTVKYRDNINVGTGAVHIEGIGNYAGTADRTFAIIALSIDSAAVQTGEEEYAYTGEAVAPEVTVTLDGRQLDPESDYSVSYINNLREGDATIVVTGRGNYRGTAYGSFRISGHLYGDWTVQKESTCTAAGLKTRTCSGCGDEQEEEIPPLGHDYEDKVVPPTLTEQGYTVHTCRRCGFVLTDTYVEPLPYQAEISCCTVKITLGSGPRPLFIVAEYDDAGRLLEAKPLPTDASAAVFTYTPSEIISSAKVKIFALEADTLRPLAPVQALDHAVGQGHTYESEIVREATCSREGERKYTCIYGDHSYTESIPKTDHTVAILPAVKPDCTHTGLTEGSKCSVCGKILKAQEAVPKAEHTPETIPAVAADCTHTGLTEGSKCSVCGAVLKAQETVAKAEHTPETIPAKPATCIETGLTEGSKCSVCGAVLKAQKTVAKAEHDWKPADCQNPKTCRVCGVTEGSPTGAHVYDSGVCTGCGAKQPLTSLSLSASSLTLSLGETAKLSAVYAPDTATAWDTFWYCDDASVATVNASGTVTAVLPGSTTIHCVRGGKTAACTVTVTGTRAQATYRYLCDFVKYNASDMRDGDYYYTKSVTTGSLALIYSPSDKTLILGLSNLDGTKTAMLTIPESLAVPYAGYFTWKSGSSSYVGKSRTNAACFGTDTYQTFYSWTGPDAVKTSSEEYFSTAIAVLLMDVEKSVLASVPNSVQDLGFTGISKYAWTGSTAPVNSLSLNKTSVSLVVGQESLLLATVRPSGTPIGWDTSNDTVVRFENGILRGLKAGTATVYASAGGTVVSCQITVTDSGGTIPEKTAYEYLWSYIVSRGTLDSTGSYELSYSSGSYQYRYSARLSEGLIRCSIRHTLSSTGSSTTTLELRENSNTAKGYIFYIVSTSYVDADYTIDTTSFRKGSVPTQTNFSSYGYTVTPELEASMAEKYSDYTYQQLTHLSSNILSPAGYTLADIGFSSMP